MLDQIVAQQKQSIGRIFDVCDVDGNGVISCKEIDTLNLVADLFIAESSEIGQHHDEPLCNFVDVDGNAETLALYKTIVKM